MTQKQAQIHQSEKICAVLHIGLDTLITAGLESLPYHDSTPGLDISRKV